MAPPSRLSQDAADADVRAASGRFPQVEFESRRHTLACTVSELLWVSPIGRQWVVNCKTDSGRSIQLIGVVPPPEPGSRLEVRGALYGRDRRSSRYAFYVGEDSLLVYRAPAPASVESAPPRAAAVEAPGAPNVSDVAAEPTTPAPGRVPGLPVDRLVVQRYLASTIDGMTDQSAKKLIEAYDPEGERRVLEVLEHADVERLRRDTGLGAITARALIDAWRRDPAMHAARIAVMSLGLRERDAQTALSRAISALERAAPGIAADPRRAAFRICQHPYRLTLIEGISFAAADKAAARLGADQDSEHRVAAAAREVLTAAAREGHTALPFHEVVDRCGSVLAGETAERRSGVRRQSPATAGDRIDPLRIAQVLRDVSDSDGLCFPSGASSATDLFALTRMVTVEREISRHLSRLIVARPAVTIASPTDEELSAIAGRQLHGRQVAAVQAALANNLTVITGGPGSGKTTMVKAIVEVLKRAGLRVVGGAPTGRAAGRITEATGLSADTIHRLLGSRGDDRGFERNAENPLVGDAFVVDESSMLDAPTFGAFLDALPVGARLIIVGDHDQLPSVGPGAVLADLIASAVAPVVRLTFTHRQGEGSPIIALARNIRDGIPMLPDADGVQLRIQHFTRGNLIARAVIDAVVRLRDNGVGLDDLVVLTPMNHGPAGVRALNERLQALFNASAAANGIEIGREFTSGNGGRRGGGVMLAAPGDRVMQTANDRSLRLANGDVGTVVDVGRGRRSLIVEFGNFKAEIQGARLRFLQLAYASTIHKSQGSEYAHVIMPISPDHQPMMRRNLLYTGVTRAKKGLELIGDMDVLIHGIRQTQDMQRCTMLQAFLRDDVLRLEGHLDIEDPQAPRLPRPAFDLQSLLGRVPELEPA